MSEPELAALVTRAAKEAIWRHRQLGEAIVIERDGKPVVIEAEDIPEEWCVAPEGRPYIP